MKLQNREMEILINALGVFKKTTNINADIQTEAFGGNNNEDDKVIRFNWKGNKWQYVAEVRNTITQTMVGVIFHRMGEERIGRRKKPFSPGPLKKILVTKYVTPQIADMLKEMNQPFIDTAGNAFINAPPLFVFIKGNRPVQEIAVKETGIREFRSTDIQVIFALLCKPGLENNAYRTIAEAAGVALGTVNWGMSALKQRGYLVDREKEGRLLIKKKELLRQWAALFPEKLRHKKILGRYKADNADWWKNVKIREYNGYWGGEIAAAKLTQYLKPQIVTIYANQQPNELLLRNRIRKDRNGDIEVLRAFWNFEPEDLSLKRDIVPPILIYADLLATGDPRNIETAEMIYELEITRLVGEDG